jgi:hypothetical protein
MNDTFLKLLAEHIGISQETLQAEIAAGNIPPIRDVIDFENAKGHLLISLNKRLDDALASSKRIAERAE